MKITVNKIDMSYDYESALSNSEVVAPLEKILDLGSMCTKEFAQDLIVTAFNLTDGTRVVDARKGYCSFRKTFGSSFDWVLGRIASEMEKYHMAEVVGGHLRSWVLNGESSGVVGKSRPDGALTLIVTTDTKSSRFGDVFLRLDLQATDGERSLYDLCRVCLSTAEGRSIAGLADIPDYIQDLEFASKAFAEAFGADYDVMRVNGDLYEGWVEAIEQNPEVLAFDAEVGHCLGRRIVHFERAFVTGPWQVSIEACDGFHELGEFAGPGLTVDPNDVYSQWYGMHQSFCGLSESEVISAVNIEHAVVDNFDRLGSTEFQERLLTDTESATKQFLSEVIRAVDRFRNDRRAWALTLFHGGHEHDVVQSGDAAPTQVQLLAPLFLDAESLASKIPSTCLVATLTKDKEANEMKCCFPSILDVKTAGMNHRFFRSAVRRGMKSK